jgi:Zn-dependent protease/CBS domain-containing protein
MELYAAAGISDGCGKAWCVRGMIARMPTSPPPQTISLGRVAGITVRVHWSWLPAVLTMWALLSVVYASAPGGVALAVLATTLLTISLLGHELAHALVARKLGLQVHGIVIFAFGGVTEIAEEHYDAPREVAVALAGPAASLALAVLASAAWWNGWGPAVVLGPLAVANWAIAAFNMLPGHPLDGGRALKGVVWFLSGDELTGSRVAALVGQGCGLGLTALGIGYAIGTMDVLNGVWVVVIGAFLWRNAMGGHRRLVLRRALHGFVAADLMRRVYRAVAPSTPLDRFVGEFVIGTDDQVYPVLSEPDAEAPQRLLGMIALRNIRRIALSEWPRTDVADAMTPASQVRSLAADTPAGEALRVLLETGEELLPVLEGETLSGVLRRADMVHFIQRRIGQGCGMRDAG